MQEGTLITNESSFSAAKAAFPFKVAAIDLDDTLLGPDKQISEANARAIRLLRERGVRIVLASGRRHENMLRFHRALGLEGPIISCQGALVRHAETGEIWHRHLMTAELASQVVQDGQARGMTQMYYHIDRTYTQGQTVFTEIYETRTGSTATRIENLAELAGDTPQKIIWICDAHDAAEMLPGLQARYAGQLEILISDPEYVEFMAMGVSKAIGLAAVAAHYGIAQSETLAFGDGNNDVTMIKWAGLGVAMDHARASAQSVADLIAPSGDPETSFARAVSVILERYAA